MTLRTVAVLFARADSVYKTMPGTDVYDAERDARTWPGGAPVVAHPPCKRWSSLNNLVLVRYPHRAEEFAHGNDGGLFKLALERVRQWAACWSIRHSREPGAASICRVRLSCTGSAASVEDGASSSINGCSGTRRES
jgi:hypothetical protein